jgi:4-hydroxy-2-oxoheptanedioate aldolase
MQVAADRRSWQEVRQRLAAGQTVVGTFVHLPSPELVEMAGLAGYDLAVLDEEHGAFGPHTLGHLLRAGAASGIPCLVRVANHDPKGILMALDLGAVGIMVPQVDSVSQARQAVAAAHFPPKGVRGMAGVVRAAGYSALEAEAFANQAESCVAVWVQIESRAGVEAAAAIAALPGVDALFVGPSDLSMDLGVPGQMGHPLVRAALRQVQAAAQEAGKPVGCFVASPQEAAVLQAEGVHLVVTSTTVTILRALREEAQRLKAP